MYELPFVLEGSPEINVVSLLLLFERNMQLYSVNVQNLCIHNQLFLNMFFGRVTAIQNKFMHTLGV